MSYRFINEKTDGQSLSVSLPSSDSVQMSLVHQIWCLRIQNLLERPFINNHYLTQTELSHFERFCLTQLLDTGRSNSVPAESAIDKICFFNDVYKREINDALLPNHMAHLVTLATLKQDEDSQYFQILYEPSMHYQVKKCIERVNCLSAKNNCLSAKIISIPEHGKPFICGRDVVAFAIKVHKSQATSCLMKFSKMGALLNADKLTSVAVEKFRNNPQNVYLFTSRLLMRRLGLNSLPTFINYELSLEDTFKFIVQSFEQQMLVLQDSQAIEKFYFYYSVLLKIMSRIDVNCLPRNEGVRRQLMHALERFKKILLEANALILEIQMHHALDRSSMSSDERFRLSKLCRTEYRQWLKYVALMMDEVMFVLGASAQHQSVFDIQAKVAEYVEKSANVNPDFATVASSGMQAIMRGLTLAIKSLFQEHDVINIYISKKNYFEILPAVNSILDTEALIRENKDCVVLTSFKDKPTEVELRNPIIHIAIINFTSNILIERQGHQFLDPFSWVRQQLEARDRLGDNSCLYLLIDRTMEAADDINLDLLNESFKLAIETGQLAIIAASSCNKYFSFGLDKTSAGLLYLFSKLEKNKALANELKAISNNDALGGFSPSSVTIQLLMKIFKLDNYLNYYASFIKDRARNLYQQQFSSLTLNKEFIIIEEPELFTYGAKKTQASSEVWPFIALRFKDFKMMQDLKSHLFTLVYHILYKFGLHFRDGFGFAETSFVRIGTDKDIILRISIGTENFADLTDLFEHLASILIIMDLELSQIYSPDHRDKGTEYFKEEVIYQRICHNVNQYLVQSLGLEPIRPSWHKEKSSFKGTDEVCQTAVSSSKVLLSNSMHGHFNHSSTSTPLSSTEVTQINKTGKPKI